MIGITDIDIIVHHNDNAEYFGAKNNADITVRGIVQANNSSTNMQDMVGPSTTMGVTVHVKSPEKCNIGVGDTFEYNGDSYNVVSIMESLMEENKVKWTPYLWSFVGKRKHGSA